MFQVVTYGGFRRVGQAVATAPPNRDLDGITYRNLVNR